MILSPMAVLWKVLLSPYSFQHKILHGDHSSHPFPLAIVERLSSFTRNIFGIVTGNGPLWTVFIEFIYIFRRPIVKHWGTIISQQISISDLVLESWFCILLYTVYSHICIWKAIQQIMWLHAKIKNKKVQLLMFISYSPKSMRISKHL